MVALRAAVALPVATSTPLASRSVARTSSIPPPAYSMRSMVRVARPPAGPIWKVKPSVSLFRSMRPRLVSERTALVPVMSSGRVSATSSSRYGSWLLMVASMSSVSMAPAYSPWLHWKRELVSSNPP